MKSLPKSLTMQKKFTQKFNDQYLVVSDDTEIYTELISQKSIKAPFRGVFILFIILPLTLSCTCKSYSLIPLPTFCTWYHPNCLRNPLNILG